MCKREGCHVYHKTKKGSLETNCRDWYKFRADYIMKVRFLNVDAPVYSSKGKKKHLLKCKNSESWRKRWGHLYENMGITSSGSVRWGSQCTTKAVGCHKDLKSWLSTLLLLFLSKVQRARGEMTGNTFKRRWLQLWWCRSGVCVCLCAPGRVVVGGWAPTEKTNWKSRTKYLAAHLLGLKKKKNKKNNSPKLFGFERPAKCYSWQLYWSFFLMNIKKSQLKKQASQKKRKRKENCIKSPVSYGLSYNKMLASKFFFFSKPKKAV